MHPVIIFSWFIARLGHTLGFVDFCGVEINSVFTLTLEMRNFL